jgi:hypothetical protein
VVVSSGRVVRIEEWCLWGGQPSNIILITKNNDGEITCAVSDPEHGGRVCCGMTAEEAIPKLHPTVRGRYIDALHMVNPTRAQLKKLFGLRHRVVFQMA